MANKTITGQYTFTIAAPIPVGGAPVSATCFYAWYPGDFPPLKGRPECRQITLTDGVNGAVINGGTTLLQLRNQFRAAIAAAEAAADGGGHSITEDNAP